MRIADTFTSNIYIKKLNWLPAKLDAESDFLARTGILRPSIMGRGPGCGQEGIVQSRAAQQPSKNDKTVHSCSKNTAAVRSNTKHWSPRAFQIPRHDGDEDEKGVVALKGNLRGTPWGVWVQETVHWLEPARDEGRGSEWDLLLRPETVVTSWNTEQSLTLMDPPPPKKPLSDWWCCSCFRTSRNWGWSATWRKKKEHWGKTHHLHADE